MSPIFETLDVKQEHCIGKQSLWILYIIILNQDSTVQPKRNAQTKFSYNQFANLVAFSLL